MAHLASSHTGRPVKGNFEKKRVFDVLYLHSDCETMTALTLHLASRAPFASQGGGAGIDDTGKWVQGSCGHLQQKWNMLRDFHFSI